MEECTNLHDVLLVVFLPFQWSQSRITNCQDVLKGVTFSVEPRMKVAVVGTLLAKCENEPAESKIRLLQVHHLSGKFTHVHCSILTSFWSFHHRSMVSVVAFRHRDLVFAHSDDASALLLLRYYRLWKIQHVVPRCSSFFSRGLCSLWHSLLMESASHSQDF